MKSSKLLFYLLIFLAFSASAQNKESILGLWLNHNGNAVIEIFQAENIFYGRIYEIMEFPEDRVKDYSQSELEKGKQKMKGRRILTGLTFNDGEWVNGQVRDPRDNSIKANCTLSLANNQKHLEIKFKKSFFSSTKVWTRYNGSNERDEN